MAPLPERGATLGDFVNALRSRFDAPPSPPLRPAGSVPPTGERPALRVVVPRAPLRPDGTWLVPTSVGPRRPDGTRVVTKTAPSEPEVPLSLPSPALPQDGPSPSPKQKVSSDQGLPPPQPRVASPVPSVASSRDTGESASSSASSDSEEEALPVVSEDPPSSDDEGSVSSSSSSGLSGSSSEKEDGAPEAPPKQKESPDQGAVLPQSPERPPSPSDTVHPPDPKGDWNLVPHPSHYTLSHGVPCSYPVPALPYLYERHWPRRDMPVNVFAGILVGVNSIHIPDGFCAGWWPHFPSQLTIRDVAQGLDYGLRFPNPLHFVPPFRSDSQRGGTVYEGGQTLLTTSHVLFPVDLKLS
jgi:hypothetical protein